MMNNVGLVLEGGGMRGVYTAGVLECFLEHDIMFPYVIGVSAGASNAASYISRQKGRNKKVVVDYVDDPRYLGYTNLFRERSLFGMNFIFDEIPRKHVPFDFDTFHQSPQKFLIGTTDVFTGEAIFFEKNDGHDPLLLLRASSSLPFMAPPIQIGGRTLFDGGIAAPIPVEQSINDGNERNVIVLTRNAGYRKTPYRFKKLAQWRYPRFKGLQETLVNRTPIYNDSLDLVEQLEKEGKAIVIRPIEPLKVTRTEKDKVRLEELYELGYRDAKNALERIKLWL